MHPHDDVPGLRERSERARAWWQGWIVKLMVVALVVIPAEECLRRRPWRDPAPRPSLSPELEAAALACERGEVDACRRAARAYLIGKGAPIDEDRAARFLERACALGDRASCPGGARD